MATITRLHMPAAYDDILRQMHDQQALEIRPLYRSGQFNDEPVYIREKQRQYERENARYSLWQTSLATATILTVAAFLLGI